LSTYGSIQNYYAFWSSFLNNTFGFPCSFDIINTFYNSTPRYGLE
jgi:hypothetical protein